MSIEPHSADKGFEKLTIIVPTIDSASYIDILLGHYATELGLPVTVYVDSKTRDDTMAVAQRVSDKVFPIENGHSRVGEIVEAMSRQCRTPWVLRIDDDELPTVAMINFVRDVIQADAADACSFPRHECAVSPEGKLLRHVAFDAGAQKQWRLYKAGSVVYRTTGHTPNFHLDGLRLLDAPPEAAMIHLDWAVHDPERRLSKVERYNAHTPNDGTRFRHVILYEEEPGYECQFQRLYLGEFDRTTKALAERFQDLTVDPLHYVLGHRIDFSEGAAAKYLSHGWSDAEKWGRWSSGRRAELAFSPTAWPEKDLVLEVRAQGLFDRSVKSSQIVALFANEEAIGQWVFYSEAAVDRSFRIPVSAVSRSRILRLRFEIASPVVPRHIGLGDDSREIGFGLITAKLRALMT